MKNLKYWAYYATILVVIVCALEPILQLTPLRHLPPFKFLLAFELWLVVLPLLALPILLWKRRWWLVGISGIGIVLWFWLYGHHLTPKNASTEAQTLRVMTWNINVNERNLSAIVAAIQRENPDVVAMQEVTNAVDQELASLLQAQYPFQARYREINYNGLAIYSKYALDSIPAEIGPDACNCQPATIIIKQQTITIIAVHPYTASKVHVLGMPIGINTRWQDQIFTILEAKIQAEKHPLIVLGDFNTTERQPNYAKMTQHLIDVYAQTSSGFGLTYPNQAKLFPIPTPPMLRLDYVFVSQDWQALRSWHRCVANVSDHCYVVADVKLK